MRFSIRHPILLISLLICAVRLLPGYLFGKTEKPTAEKAATAIVGEWKAVDKEDYAGGLDGVKKVIFMPDGKMWLIDGNNKAFKALYWTNSLTEPMQMDILSSAEVWMTTYNFLDYNTIRILPHQQGLQQMRYRNLQSGGVEFKRMSDRTKLDAIIKVGESTPPSVEIQESEAMLYLTTLIFATRDYRDYKKVFPTKLSDMSVGFTKNFLGYRYQIQLWGDRNALIFAQPSSPNLKSFTALLTTEEGYSSSVQICRSQQPALEPPKFILNSNGCYECAPGGTGI